MKKDKDNSDKETNPMNSKKEVENSNDNKTNEDFKGYPHYPAKDAMMKEEKEENLSENDKEFSKPQEEEKTNTSENKNEVLRGELDNKSGKLPGKK